MVSDIEGGPAIIGILGVESGANRIGCATADFTSVGIPECEVNDAVGRTVPRCPLVRCPALRSIGDNQSVCPARAGRRRNGPRGIYHAIVVIPRTRAVAGVPSAEIGPTPKLCELQEPVEK